LEGGQRLRRGPAVGQQWLEQARPLVQGLLRRRRCARCSVRSWASLSR
jgi:hypothetical protein